MIPHIILKYLLGKRMKIVRNTSKFIRHHIVENNGDITSVWFLMYYDQKQRAHDIIKDQFSKIWNS